jgi:type VI secretion system secreted protein VgrG
VTFVLTDELTGTPVKHQPYRIILPDNRAVEGITSDKGETTVATNEIHGKFKFELLPRNWTR